jgi:hypothetical protein
MKSLADLNLTPRAKSTIQQMDEAIANGATVHMKWTCVHCGARQTFVEPNSVYETGGRCEECNKVTDVLQDERADTNFLAIWGGGSK